MTEPASSPPRGRFDYVIESATSRDGTTIGYRRYGAGPAVILVQGAIGTTHSFHELAADLASDFAVYVPERRGRPLSPRQYTPDHVIARDVEDLEAVFDRSGARFLFGLSSGAVIALEAARVLPAVRKLALFEAPLYVPPRRMRLDLVSRFDREVEAGATAAAMVTALIASGLAPPLVEAIPRRLIEPALALFLRRDARRRAGDYPPLRDLVPTMRYDFKVVGSMQNKFADFGAVAGAVLLLGCAKSPAYLRESAVALDRVLPTSRRIEFDGLDHSAPWNADRGGKPAIVAAALRDFFGA